MKDREEDLYETYINSYSLPKAALEMRKQAENIFIDGSYDVLNLFYDYAVKQEIDPESLMPIFDPLGKLVMRMLIKLSAVCYAIHLDIPPSDDDVELLKAVLESEEK